MANSTLRLQLSLALAALLAACSPPDEKAPAGRPAYRNPHPEWAQGPPAPSTPETPALAAPGPALRATHGACFGTCPTYQIELRPDGVVHYRGGPFAAIEGPHSWRVDPTVVERLVARARADGFFRLPANDGAYGSDLPDLLLTLCDAGQCRAVRNLPDAPGMVWTLARDAGLASGARPYVGVTTETVTRLKFERFDFRSDEGGCLLARASQMRDAAAVRSLVALHTPLTLTCEDGSAPTPLLSAINDPDPAIFKALVAAGVLHQTSTADLKQLAGNAERNGRPYARALRRAAVYRPW